MGCGHQVDRDPMIDRENSAGRFITFEGGEGSGKSTATGALVETLSASGLSVLATREPGGPPGAEQIRNLLVSGEVDRWDPMAEALLKHHQGTAMYVDSCGVRQGRLDPFAVEVLNEIGVNLTRHRP